MSKEVKLVFVLKNHEPFSFDESQINQEDIDFVFNQISGGARVILINNKQTGVQFAIRFEDVLFVVSGPQE